MAIRRAKSAVARAIKPAETSPEVKTARVKLRNLYKKVKQAALVKEAAESERKSNQREAVELAQEFGLGDRPIRFTLEGKIYSGTICAPKAAPRWNQEAVIEWLHRSGRWEACSTRAFDQEKFEAEIAKGNIPSKTVEKFLTEGTPITPYARIVEV